MSKQVQIPEWLINALFAYFITDTENRERYEVAIKDGLMEKADKMIARMDYEKAL